MRSNVGLDEPEWFDRAVCKEENREIFFPEKETKEAVERAKAFCNTCSVLSDCFFFAAGLEAVGIWGGTSTKERLDMRQLVACSPTQLLKGAHNIPQNSPSPRIHSVSYTQGIHTQSILLDASDLPDVRVPIVNQTLVIQQIEATLMS